MDLPTPPVRLSAGQKGRYTVSTTAEGPAEEAGVRTGDRLVWINGVMASTLTHAVLSRMVLPASCSRLRDFPQRTLALPRPTPSLLPSCWQMKRRSEDSLTVLVIDRHAESCFARRKMAILPVVAECRGLPFVAKTMHLAKGPDGYGFLLRQERLASSRRTGSGHAHRPDTSDTRDSV